MGGFSGQSAGPGGSGGGASAALGKRLAYTSPAGAAVAATPPITITTGRLLVTLTANTTWVSLTAGAQDGQLLVVDIVAGNFTLILPAADFPGFGDLNLGLGNRVLLYWDTTDTLWERTSP